MTHVLALLFTLYVKYGTSTLVETWYRKPTPQAFTTLHLANSHPPNFTMTKVKTRKISTMKRMTSTVLLVRTVTNSLASPRTFLNVTII